MWQDGKRRRVRAHGQSRDWAFCAQSNTVQLFCPRYRCTVNRNRNRRKRPSSSRIRHSIRHQFPMWTGLHACTTDGVVHIVHRTSVHPPNPALPMPTQGTGAHICPARDVGPHLASFGSSEGLDGFRQARESTRESTRGKSTEFGSGLRVPR